MVTGILTLFFSEFFSRIALKYKVAPDNSYSEQVQDILIGPRVNDLYMFHHCRTGSPLARTNLSPFAQCTLGLSRHFY